MSVKMVQKFTLWATVILITVCAFESCSKNKQDPPDFQYGAEVDVYVAGAEQTTAGKWVAKYWKNGTPVELSDGVNNAEATSVFVLGEDVYVAGQETDNTTSIAKYWKNGAEVALTDGTERAEVHSIFVEGQMVYVAGALRDNLGRSRAVYWKNGTPFTLSSSSGMGMATAIAAAHGNVYVAGYEEEGTKGWKAKVWENDIATQLSSTNSYADALFLDGNDVYVSGSEDEPNGDRIGKVWKNGHELYRLNEEYDFGLTYSLFVEKGEVYVAGSERSAQKIYAAKVWHNGKGRKLNPEAEDSNTFARAVAAHNGEIYVVNVLAPKFEFEGEVRLWKNGQYEKLTDKGKGNAVFVVEKRK